MRSPRFLSVLAAVAVLTVACGSDDDGAATDGTGAPTASTDPASTETTIDPTDATDTTGPDATADTGVPVTSADAPPLDGRVAPAGPAEVTGAADVATLLAQLGFPDGFPVPDGLQPADIVGLRLDQSVGDEYVGTESVLAWREPAPEDPGTLAAEWYERGRDGLGVPASLMDAVMTGNELEGFYTSGGEEDEENGSFIVTVIRPEGDTAAEVVIELRHEIEVAGGEFDLQYAPELAAGLPDMTGCVAEFMVAGYRDYVSPNDFLEEPAYSTIWEGNCPAATMEAVRAWTETVEGQENVNEQNINVSEVAGPAGSAIQLSAYLNDDSVALRIDTVAPIG